MKSHTSIRLVRMAPRPNLDGGGVWQGVVGGSVAGEEWTFFKSSSIMKKILDILILMLGPSK